MNIIKNNFEHSDKYLRYQEIIEAIRCYNLFKDNGKIGFVDSYDNKGYLTKFEEEWLKEFISSYILKRMDYFYDNMISDKNKNKLKGFIDFYVMIDNSYYLASFFGEYRKDIFKALKNTLYRLDEDQEAKKYFSVNACNCLAEIMIKSIKEENNKSLDHAEKFGKFLIENDYIDKEVLISSNILELYAVEDLIDLRDKNVIDNRQLISILRAYSENDDESEALLEVYSKVVKLNEANTYKKQIQIKKEYLNLFDKDVFCRLYLRGDISEEDFKLVKLEKSDILKLTPKEIIELSEKKCIDILHSEDFIDSYGDKFVLDDLIEFYNHGLVKPEHIIRTLKVKCVEENREGKILDFYNGELLLKLLEENKINKRFIETFNNELLDKLSEEDKNTYFQKIKDDIKKISNGEYEFLENIIKLYKNNLIPAEPIKDKEMDKSDILELYLKDKLSNEDIYKMYKDKILTLEDLSIIYSNEELLNLYKDKKIGSEILKMMKNDDIYIYLSDALEKGELDGKDILNCYLEDSIDVNLLKEILYDNDKLEDLSEYLSDSCKLDKIKELTENYLISYIELENLKNNGIITEEQFNTLSELSDKEKFFDNLKSLNSIFIVENVENVENVESNRNVRGGEKLYKHPKKDFKISPDTIKEFYKEIGALDNFPKIDSDESSLKDYSIIGFEKYGIVILENFEKPSNATYIMPYQQLLFYLNNSKKAEAVFGNSDDNIRLKAAFRSSDKIRVHNHTSGFGKNIINSIGIISKEAKEELKINENYREMINMYIEEIKNEYERNR